MQKKLSYDIITILNNNILFFSNCTCHIIFTVMKYIIAFCIILFTNRIAKSNHLQNQILRAEQLRYDAMIALDTNALKSMLAPSLQYYHSNGKLDTKQSLLISIGSKELVHQAITIEENLVRIFKRNTAIVSGKCVYKIIYHNVPMVLHFVFTNVYIRRRGKWLLANRQTTKID
jgi:Domain of unknown function (DUF4440)